MAEEKEFEMYEEAGSSNDIIDTPASIEEPAISGDTVNINQNENINTTSFNNEEALVSENNKLNDDVIPVVPVVEPSYTVPTLEGSTPIPEYNNSVEVPTMESNVLSDVNMNVSNPVPQDVENIQTNSLNDSIPPVVSEVNYQEPIVNVTTAIPEYNNNVEVPTMEHSVLPDVNMNVSNPMPQDVENIQTNSLNDPIPPVVNNKNNDMGVYQLPIEGELEPNNQLQQNVNQQENIHVDIVTPPAPMMDINKDSNINPQPYSTGREFNFDNVNNPEVINQEDRKIEIKDNLEKKKSVKKELIIFIVICVVFLGFMIFLPNITKLISDFIESFK